MTLRLLSLLLIWLLWVAPASADRLFLCGFEENNDTLVHWNRLGAAPAFDTTQKHSGTYSLKTVENSTKGLERGLEPVQTSGTLFARMYFRINGGTRSSWEPVLSFFNNSNGSTGAIAEIFPNDRTFRIRNALTATTSTSTATLSADTWYRFEMNSLLSDTVGTMDLRVFLGDSDTEVEDLTEITGEDTLPVGGSVQSVRFSDSVGDPAVGTWFIDDVGIGNDTGSAPFNTWLGPGKIFMLEPSGDNTITWDRIPTNTTNWDRVDDLPGTPDDATTYIHTSVSETDKLDLSNLGAEVPSGADIIVLAVYGRQGSDGTTGTRNLNYALWDEGDSQTTGPDVDCKINGWRKADNDESIVFDAGSRTKANIDSFRIGYLRSHGGGNEDRITTLWMAVEWIEAAAAAARRKIVVY